MSPKDNKSGIFHSWPFGRKNYLLFLIGVVTIVFGYVLMYLTADIVWAPVILVIGYCVIIPISIMIK
ncbi:MAG: hypothetical protein CBD21_03380 [bacterium TMED161]|nr:MAG: hypothetical protein CBD21_03380 [bacterium TMED161]|tara:strand:- start:53 stop:253 length:201 start_codon:yes stop_codon:yes gene_type:complete